jgi:type III secretion system YscQ/HrcQ family protein
MPQVRPFLFTNLPRYTHDQIAVLQSLQAYFSQRPFSRTFLDEMGSLLEGYLKAPCAIAVQETQTVARTNLGALLPAVGCLLVIGCAPGEHKILVDLDPSIATLAIDRLLGGNGEASRIQRALTEIEEGVLSFIILKALTFVHDAWETGRELALTLDRFASRLEELQPIIDSEPGYHVLSLSLGVGKKVGYARILVPDTLITTRFQQALAQAGGPEAERRHMRTVFRALGERDVTARVEVAQLDLGPDDIAGLEEGDIVILENHQLVLGPEGLSGLAFVKLGTGRNGGLRTQIQSDGERVRLVVAGIVVQEEPAESEMADGSEEQHDIVDDNLAETEGLLRDVPAPVVVELGRIRMNTAQVIRLRQGQILRLPRGPNDPVDLVVNGKVFARGELIEVDGELGVRLLQVTGV